MKCVKCEQEIPNVKFCPICGANQEQSDNNVNQNVKIENLPNNINNDINEEKGDKPIDKKKGNLTFYIIFSVVAVIFSGIFIFIIIQYLNPKININGLKKEYTYNEIIKESFTIDNSMFINPENTKWSINGYDFATGKKVTNIPVIIGDNTLVITNNGTSNTYYFTVTNDSYLLSEGNYSITPDYLDFDSDGISNIVEDDLGLSSKINDTDGDGLLDNVELIMGLDPLKKDDYDKSREFKVIQDNYKGYKNYLMVTSKGNVANTYLDKVDLNVGFSSTFIQSDTLKITTTNDETPDAMTIYFKKENNWNNKEYSIYMFNEVTGKLNELNTKVSDSYLIANVSEFDNIYFVGKKSNVPKKYLNQIIILIDNSGSMFPMEYVTSKKGDPSSYSHDTEFKRLSMMTELVDQLGTDNYEYSVYAFTATHCDMIKYSSDAVAIKKGINSLKTECQKFNGTDMSGAIKKYANTFKDDVYGAKYMIVLTDGKDTSNYEFNLSEYYLNNYRKQGIHIITLGLSSEVNSDYLMNIAYLTKGKYLFASDAKMLDTLSSIIESSINNSHDTTTINDKDYMLVADSGFQVDRDGFSFENFGSKDSPTSNSYGFSYLAKQIYLNQLFDENGKSDIVKNALTENNKEKLIKGNIYNITLSDEYINMLYNSDEYIDLTNSNNTDDDYQLLQIINQAFKVQSKIFINKTSDYVLKHFQGQFYDYDTDLNKMIDELQSGSPAIISLISSAGTHSVLATKIYKAVGKDEYVITVYDSTTPGEEGEIYLKRLSPYYEYANSTYYSLSYTANNIEFTNMLYVDQY